MAFSIRINGLYGISPCLNQIKNIGVDGLSTHGGNSYASVMTRRFCGMESMPMDFPLVHPKVVMPDSVYEKKISKIILYPLKTRLIVQIAKFIKQFLGLREDDSFSLYLKNRKNKTLGNSHD